MALPTTTRQIKDHDPESPTAGGQLWIEAQYQAGHGTPQKYVRYDPWTVWNGKELTAGTFKGAHKTSAGTAGVSGTINSSVTVSEGIITSISQMASTDLTDTANIGYLDAANVWDALNKFTLDSTEGTPTLAASTIASFQNNSVAGDDASISIIAGSTGKSRVLFGDASDQDIGYIEYNHNTNKLGFGTNTNKNIYMNNLGYFGINEFDPQRLLHVSDQSNARFRLDSTTAAGVSVMEFYNGGNYIGYFGKASSSEDDMFFAGLYSNTGVRFRTQNLDRIILDKDGPVKCTDTFQIEKHLILDEVTAPGTPTASTMAIYAKSDGKLYYKNDAGTEFEIATV